MSNQQVRLAIVGCGGIARRHVVAMKDLIQRGRDDFSIVALCDTMPELAEALAGQIKEDLGQEPAIYSDYQDMLAQEQLDGVDLCLPHGLHHSFSITALEAGVHVLCEKPIGVTIRAGQLMAEAAARTGKILSIAVPHRRQPGQRVASWVLNESGLVGNPLTVPPLLHATAAAGGPQCPCAGASTLAARPHDVRRRYDVGQRLPLL